VQIKFEFMSDNISIEILENSIQTDIIQQFISRDDCGGLVLFVGTVRNNTANKKVLHLEFEAYEPMAKKEMAKIADYILSNWSAARVAIHHRTGLLQIGDTAVAIGVSCAHRQEAFEACAYAIDTLKQTVPIWKKEVFEDGEVWVAAHP
jgi:molybdopterin synthase catalytic subunit